MKIEFKSILDMVRREILLLGIPVNWMEHILVLVQRIETVIKHKIELIIPISG